MHIFWFYSGLWFCEAFARCNRQSFAKAAQDGPSAFLTRRIPGKDPLHNLGAQEGQNAGPQKSQERQSKADEHLRIQYHCHHRERMQKHHQQRRGKIAQAQK